METFVITGGTPLTGTVQVRGSKNAASKMMIASLLTQEQCFIENMPLSQETDITKELCEHIGSTVQLDASSRTCAIQTAEITNPRVSQLSRKNRIPILAFGPLLHRKQVAEIPVLGGCPIGHRPVNIHLEALKQMGVFIQRREHSYYASAKEIHGADITLAYPSVGATENIILTAVLAQGQTRITNAAIEPEIINVIQMLTAMGAKIIVDAAKRSITITGVKKLGPTRARVMADRNEIVSFASAALATRGDIFIPEISTEPIATFLQKVEEIGAHYTVAKGGIRFKGSEAYKPAPVSTSPHPGFMTDWQQPFAVVLTQAQGASTIHETVYEDRLGYMNELNQMGASIELSEECVGQPCRFKGKHFIHSARIQGVTPLKATKASIPDLRAGMALIIAALQAKGTSTLSGIELVERGYESIDERLIALGANIKRGNHA